MSVEVQWTDEDPTTAEKRFVRVTRFAGVWEFRVRFRRRENWIALARVSRDMWETLLESLERRYFRREGVSDEDLKAVRMIIRNHKDAPTIEGDQRAEAI